MTDQTQTTTEPVAWRVRTTDDHFAAFIVTDPKTYENGRAGWLSNGWIIDALGVITSPQPLAIGLDRARLIKAMRENITIGDIGSCSISLDGFEDAADRILALAAPAEGWQGIETERDNG